MSTEALRAAERKKRADVIRDRLLASQIVIEDGPTVQGRSVSWFHSFRPQNFYQQWLVDQVAILSLRIDRVERIERRQRDMVALRAEVSWDSDRRVEVETLGAMLPKQPSIVVEKLKATPHGCDWLIHRWSLLAYAADIAEGKGWTADQASMAFDMLGTPENLRIGRPGLELDDNGRVIDSGDDPASVARREVARLKLARERVADLDETARFLAASDLTDGTSPELIQLRRYESSLQRQLRWLMAQFKEKAADPRQLHPLLRPQYVSEPEPDLKPVHPPTADTVLGKAEMRTSSEVEAELQPMLKAVATPVAVEVPRSRRDDRLDRGVSRREAKRRKRERAMA